MAEIIGNAGDNILFGTPEPDRIFGVGGNDILFGEASDDFVDGGTGNDFIDGGTGNDRGFGDAGNDTLYGNDGDDLIDGGSENDTLLGWNGNDTLLGDTGDDLLNGQAGINTLIGGTGNDIYVLNSRADSIFEAPDAGIDTVRSPFNFKLPRDFDNLELTGDAPITGRGNNANNILRGNSANNRLFGLGGDDELYGGRGRDTLTGNAGSNRFSFNSPNEGRDRITDFAASRDSIGIVRGGFGRNLRRGTLSANQFRVGARAATSSDRFVYDPGRGALYFDPDGSGGSRQVEIASLASNLNFTHRNIVVF